MPEFGVNGLPRAQVSVECKGASPLELHVTARGLRSSLNLGEHMHALLHWAVLNDDGGWELPAKQPAGSKPCDAAASRLSLNGTSGSLVFPADAVPSKIVFVLLVEAHGQQHWLKADGDKDFIIDVADLASQAAPVAGTVAANVDASFVVAERPKEWPELEAAKKEVAENGKATNGKKVKKKGEKKPPAFTDGAFDVEGALGSMSWQAVTGPTGLRIFVEAAVRLHPDAELFLHWGCVDSVGGEWKEPEEPVAGAVPCGDGKASRSLLAGQSRVIMAFSPASAPPAITFVLYAKAGGAEQWLKTSGGGDFCMQVVPLKEGASSADGSVDEKFCDAETKYSHWSQFQRVCLANEVFSGASVAPLQAAWLATTLRLAHAKKLEWYRNRGYQPKDMAHAQEALGGNLSAKCQEANQPVVRALLRLCVPAVARGSSSGGDAIRHGILNIMRNHGIKEGHRPGIECKFIEQWHQKLHTNSAPDDIQICEGYLRFLGSGNPDDMFGHLEYCGITREDLGKMCMSGFKDHTKSGGKGLNVNPLHLPQLQHDMGNYLNLLKHVHGGSDLFSLCEACKGQYPDHGTECFAFEIYHARDDPMTMGKIVELRQRLSSELWKRDVLMLDVALEDQLRSLAERTRIADLSEDDLLGYLRCVLRDLGLSRRDVSLDHGFRLFEKLTGDCGDKWSTEWCKLMHAACDRLSLVCTATIDELVSLLQGCADKLRAAGAKRGAVFTPDEKVLEAFGEETARCLTERLAAQALRLLMPRLRRKAGLGPWEIVSQGASSGTVGEVAVMASLPVALDKPENLVVAVVETMTGWEDIPAGVAAVLLPASQAVDVLSHVAIRARNQKVLLASCDDDGQLSELRAASGKRLQLEASATGLAWSESTAAAAAFNPAPRTGAPAAKITIMKPPPPPSLALKSADFAKNKKCMGGKSLHLAELAPKSGAYSVPTSATVPFGVFEKALEAEENAEVREELEELVEDEDWAGARKCIVESLCVPADVEKALRAEMEAAGAPALPEDRDLWQRALKGVWASKWTERAVSSRKQMSIPDSSLYLAVLCQPLFPSAYAFVLHTRSPLPGAAADQQLVELCVGLGESLVSNSPGRALSASVGPAGTPIAVHAYPSKPDGVYAPEVASHIFRSDSNGEDLEGFAGAGLYDSITTIECSHRAIDYTQEPLLFDAKAREALLRRLYDLGKSVEANFGGKPQDVEGAVGLDGGLVVTQSRPQV